MNAGAYRIEEIQEHVTLIDDATGSSAWLITGETSALLVDTGWGDGDFAGIVRSLTGLPVRLFVTHAHIDHYRHVADFPQAAYMHRLDWEALPEAKRMFDGNAPDPEQLIPVDEGFSFDLGGATATVYLAGGHTPGSAVIVVPEYRCVFTGDAFGSGVGVWMQVPMSLTLPGYRDSLADFLKKCAFTRDYRYCGGHYQQGAQNPLCYALVEDMHTLCCRLIDGDREGVSIQPSDSNRFTPEQAYTGAFGRASMEFLESKRNSH